MVAWSAWMSMAPLGLLSFSDVFGEAGVAVGDCATRGVGWEGHSGASAAHPVDAMADSDAKVAPFASVPKAPQATFGHLSIENTVM
jgi:hypothetical protein